MSLHSGIMDIMETQNHMSTKGEFGFIDYIKELFPCPDGIFGIGDDCAILPSPEGEVLFSTDLLMEGVHFLRSESSPEDVGWKAAAVNISDIAAMGGTPVATFLSIALPKDAQGEWAERFMQGYSQMSRIYNIPLLGGDTTSSLHHCYCSIQVHPDAGRKNGRLSCRSDGRGNTV